MVLAGNSTEYTCGIKYTTPAIGIIQNNIQQNGNHIEQNIVFVTGPAHVGQSECYDGQNNANCTCQKQGSFIFGVHLYPPEIA
mgnify:CR=1 FL=1